MSNRLGCVRLMTSLWFVASILAAAQNPPGMLPAPSPTTADLNKGAEAEVLAAVAARDKAFLAGDEKAVAQFMAEDYLQTDVLGHVQATWPATQRAVRLCSWKRRSFQTIP